MRRLALLTAPLLVLALTALVPACGGVEGSTPDCTNNIGEDGVDPNVGEGCQGFAVCEADPGNPAACCPLDPMVPNPDCEQRICLFGFGVRTPETDACLRGGGSGGSGGSGGGS